MNTRPSKRSSIAAPLAAPVCVVRWILRTGSAAIACEVDMNADRTFDLRITPSSQPKGTLVERFKTALSALERHAEVAQSLRDSGWQVTDRSVGWPTAA